MIRNFALLTLLTGLLLTGLHQSSYGRAAADAANGEKIFKQHCAACHKPNQKLVGPALQGVNDKYADDRQWLYEWVRNAPGMVKDGDPKAVELFEAYNQLPMTAFPFLKDQEVEDIFAWVDEVAPVATAAAAEVPAAAAPAQAAGTFTFVIGLLTGVMIMIGVVLVFIAMSLRGLIRQKEAGE